MEEVRTLNNSRSRLSHHTLSFPCPLVLYQIESSVYEQTLLSPHRAWVFLLKWFRSYTCWVLEHKCYFLKLQCMLLKERSWSTHGKRMYGFRLCVEHQEMLLFNQVGVLVSQRLCPSMKGRKKIREPLWKTALLTLLFWTLWPFWWSSLLFFSACFWGPSLFLPSVFILHGSLQLTHFVSVIRQIRRGKITVSVASHSFRSTGLLSRWHSLIALLGA